MLPGQDLDLDHSDDGIGYRYFSHAFRAYTRDPESYVADLMPGERRRPYAENSNVDPASGINAAATAASGGTHTGASAPTSSSSAHSRMLKIATTA